MAALLAVAAHQMVRVSTSADTSNGKRDAKNAEYRVVRAVAAARGGYAKKVAETEQWPDGKIVNTFGAATPVEVVQAFKRIMGEDVKKGSLWKVRQKEAAAKATYCQEQTGVPHCYGVLEGQPFVVPLDGKHLIPSLRFLLLLLAGWVNRKQLEVIDYLKEENRILREQMHGRRLRFTDDQRRRLAVRGKVLGRKRLQAVTSLLTPDTILRWYRELIADKYNSATKRPPGRPSTAVQLKQLVAKFAAENPGYTRLRGALRNLGHVLGRNTIKRILNELGIQPAPARSQRMPWKTFIKAHLGAIAATDLNAYAERFVLSIKSECLNKLVPLGERHLRHAVNEFVEHYHLERNHQGPDNQLLTSLNVPANDDS